MPANSENHNSNKKNHRIIKSYKPISSKKYVESIFKSLVSKANYQKHTSNQNKEQKALWGTAEFIEEDGETSSSIQGGFYRLSSELNDSPNNHGIVGQLQLDILNAELDCSITEGGGKVSFGLNGLSVSGNIGFQFKTNERNVKISLGGSAGAQIGGEVQVDASKGVFVFDVSVIFGGRIELNWGKVR